MFGAVHLRRTVVMACKRLQHLKRRYTIWAPRHDIPVFWPIIGILRDNKLISYVTDTKESSQITCYSCIFKIEHNDHVIIFNNGWHMKITNLQGIKLERNNTKCTHMLPGCKRSDDCRSHRMPLIHNTWHSRQGRVMNSYIWSLTEFGFNDIYDLISPHNIVQNNNKHIVSSVCVYVSNLLKFFSVTEETSPAEVIIFNSWKIGFMLTKHGSQIQYTYTIHTTVWHIHWVIQHHDAQSKWLKHCGYYWRPASQAFKTFFDQSN